MRDLQSASSGFLCTKKLSWFSFPIGMQQGWEGGGRERGERGRAALPLTVLRAHDRRKPGYY